MNRADAIARLGDRGEDFDLLVVGGGATGLGCAVDAASRGHRVALVEQADFAQATSSRSTKLVHGGVRYLRQGNVSLVLEALRERALLCTNAPHIVRHQSFIVPLYSWWEGPFYGIGLKVYDALAGRLGLRPSKLLSEAQTLERIPTLESEGLLGGVIYYDGQFDDARLAVHLARTVADHGGVAANYVRVVGLHKAAGLVGGAECVDTESGESFTVRARAVLNATGAFSDQLRQLDDPEAPPMMSASQGVHLVLPKRFVPGRAAVLVPQTSDGRVLFAVPWHGHVVVGTTDTPVDEAVLEPRPFSDEIDFILENAARYLGDDPTRDDVLSAFAGLRPLVRDPSQDPGAGTAALSRDHVVMVSDSGLITLTGGKWTTYRKMAEDGVDQVEMVAGLPRRPCVTADLRIHGAPPGGGVDEDGGEDGGGEGLPAQDANALPHPLLALHGTDAPAVAGLADRLGDPTLALPIHPDLPYLRAEVVWAARQEMARTVEDVLARRTRALFLNARAAAAAADDTAQLLAAERGLDDAWAQAEAERFRDLAAGYLPG